MNGLFDTYTVPPVLFFRLNFYGIGIRICVFGNNIISIHIFTGPLTHPAIIVILNHFVTAILVVGGHSRNTHNFTVYGFLSESSRGSSLPEQETKRHNIPSIRIWAEYFMIQFIMSNLCLGLPILYQRETSMNYYKCTSRVQRNVRDLCICITDILSQYRCVVSRWSA